MSLKLFRSTGYESILFAGETRVALHPGWMVTATSLWIGFVCNVAVWRKLAGNDPSTSAGRVLMLGTFVAAACFTLLSLVGWRKTVKPAALLLVWIAALAACSIWSQAIPVDGTLLDRRLSSLVFPPWASLFRWQIWASLAGLALLPSIWIWNTTLRRLTRQQQFSANVSGVVAGAMLMAATGYLLR